MTPYYFEGCGVDDNSPIEVCVTDTEIPDNISNKPIKLRFMKILDIPRRYITANPGEILQSIGELFPPLKLIDQYVVKPIVNINQAIETERENIWPLFLRDQNISNFNFLYNCCPDSSTPSITHNFIEANTNAKIKKSFQTNQEIHTVRVLYRDQDPLLKILLSYHNRKNNIYFTDYSEGNLRALSLEGVKSHRDVKNKIGISQESYLTNPDFFYLIEMIDLLKTLCLFRSNKHATYWKTTQTPSLRCTIFGELEDPAEIHCVAMPEFNPGVSGRLIVTPPEWHGFVTDELNHEYYNNPVLVSDIDKEFTTLYYDYLMPHWIDLKQKYQNQIERYHINIQCVDDYLIRTRRFNGGIDEWNAQNSPLPRLRVDCIKKIQRISSLTTKND